MTIVRSPILVPQRLGPVVAENLTGPVSHGTAGLTDGRAVVVWSGDGLDASGAGVLGRIVSPDGTQGPVFPVNSFQTGAQTRPDVAQLGDGGFVVVWESAGQDGDGLGVYGQRFDPAGRRVGPEFQISEDRPGNQQAPRVTALAEDGFAVAWFDAAEGTRARAYGADGAPLGDPVAVAALGSAGGWALEIEAHPARGYVVMVRPVFSFTPSGWILWHVPEPGVSQPRPLPAPPSFSRLDRAHSFETFPLGDGTLIEWFSRTPPQPFAGTEDFIGRIAFDGNRLAVPQVNGAPGPGFRDMQGDFAPVAGGVFGAFLREWSVFAGAPYSLVTQFYRVNAAPTGIVRIEGAAEAGGALRAVVENISDPDGLGPVTLTWRVADAPLLDATGGTFRVTDAMIARTITVEATFTDGSGTLEAVVSPPTEPVRGVVRGTAGDDFIWGTGLADAVRGLQGNDTILGEAGNDTLWGGDGADTLNGGTGDDLIFGGDTEADMRDVIYGGDGNDTAWGGWGNDITHGGEGDDVLAGDFGSDTLIGNAGNDTLVGGPGSDEIHGGPGDDFIAGGFGHDRLHGGPGADRFFHAGAPGWAADWIRDYSRAEGDVLLFGIGTARAADFQINRAFTPGAGRDDVAEAFVIYRPTGAIIWALVDGAAQPLIRVQVNNDGVNAVFDLL